MKAFSSLILEKYGEFKNGEKTAIHIYETVKYALEHRQIHPIEINDDNTRRIVRGYVINKVYKLPVDTEIKDVIEVDCEACGSWISKAYIYVWGENSSKYRKSTLGVSCGAIYNNAGLALSERILSYNKNDVISTILHELTHGYESRNRFNGILKGKDKAKTNKIYISTGSEECKCYIENIIGVENLTELCEKYDLLLNECWYFMYRFQKTEHLAYLGEIKPIIRKTIASYIKENNIDKLTSKDINNIAYSVKLIYTYGLLDLTDYIDVIWNKNNIPQKYAEVIDKYNKKTAGILPPVEKESNPIIGFLKRMSAFIFSYIDKQEEASEENPSDIIDDVRNIKKYPATLWYIARNDNQAKAQDIVTCIYNYSNNKSYTKERVYKEYRYELKKASEKIDDIVRKATHEIVQQYI